MCPGKKKEREEKGEFFFSRFERWKMGGVGKWWQSLFALRVSCISWIYVPRAVMRNGSAYLNADLLWELKVSQCSGEIFPMDEWINKCHGQISQRNYGILLQSGTIDKSF